MKKYLLLKPIFSILFVIACHTLCNGETQTDFENMFRCSLLDKSGNLWFGTTGKGVYRYNAATADFTNFTTSDGLSDNFVSAIIEDKAGNIWFGTTKGVCRYDGKSFTDATKNEALCSEDINTILEDKTEIFGLAQMVGEFAVTTLQQTRQEENQSPLLQLKMGWAVMQFNVC